MFIKYGVYINANVDKFEHLSLDICKTGSDIPSDAGLGCKLGHFQAWWMLVAKILG